jgi:hypothetical protein
MVTLYPGILAMRRGPAIERRGAELRSGLLAEGKVKKSQVFRYLTGSRSGARES